MKINRGAEGRNYSFFGTLVGSLLLHLSLLALLNRQAPPPVPTRIQVELVSPPPVTSSFAGEPGGPPRPNTHRRGRPRKSTSPKLIGVDFRSALADLALKRAHHPVEKSTTPQEDDSAIAALDPFAGMPTGEIRFMKALWTEIDQSIADSPLLSEYNHTGAVQIRFRLDAFGKLVTGDLHACGEDPILKVLALRAIRRALKNENRRLDFSQSPGRLSARFSWADYAKCRRLRGVDRGGLSFCHYAENKRKDFSAGEKTATYLGALRYGFGAIEEIKKYRQEENRRRTEFDPFVELRRDPDWNIGC